MEEPLTPRHVLEGKELIDYLVERAAHDAKTALVEQEERRKRRVTLILSVIALVGVSSIVSALKVFVHAEMEVVNGRLKDAAAEVEKRIEAKAEQLRGEFKAKVDQAVVDQIEKQIGDVRQTLENKDLLERYVELAMELPERLSVISRRKDKYGAELLQETLTAAEKMAALPASMRRTRFMVATRQIVDALTKYTRDSEINRLDDLLGEVIATDQELARILVDHYGQLVVGSPQSVDSQPQNVQRLYRYIRAAQELNYPEKALLWTLFVEFKRNGGARSEAIDGLLESSKDLAQNDNAEFWFALYVYTNPLNWLRESTQQGRELQQLVEGLQVQYPIITTMMEQNIANHGYLQDRLATARRNNPAWQEAPAEVEAESGPEDTAESETAAAPSDENALRQ